MDRWESIFDIESEKIKNSTEEFHSQKINEINKKSREIYELIDKILNKVTRTEEREHGTNFVIRTNEVAKEWEATFSVINMSNRPIMGLIKCGYYLQAISLIRQEFEGIAQLDHIISRKRKTTAGPNISVLDNDIRRWYGDLSQGAHLSSHEAASIQSPPPTGFEKNFAVFPHMHSVLPVYNKSMAEELLSMHFKLRCILHDKLLRHIQINLPECV